MRLVARLMLLGVEWHEIIPRNLCRHLILNALGIKINGQLLLINFSHIIISWKLTRNLNFSILTLFILIFQVGQFFIFSVLGAEFWYFLPIFGYHLLSIGLVISSCLGIPVFHAIDISFINFLFFKTITKRVLIIWVHLRLTL